MVRKAPLMSSVRPLYAWMVPGPDAHWIEQSLKFGNRLAAALELFVHEGILDTEAEETELSGFEDSLSLPCQNLQDERNTSRWCPTPLG